FSWLDRDADDLVAEPHGGAIDDAPGELSAGGIDVLAARAAHRREQPALQQLVPEALDHRGARATVARARKWIEGNEVEHGRVPLHKPRERTRLRRGVVHSLEHLVLERDAAAVLLV